MLICSHRIILWYSPQLMATTGILRILKMLGSRMSKWFKAQIKVFKRWYPRLSDLPIRTLSYLRRETCKAKSFSTKAQGINRGFQMALARAFFCLALSIKANGRMDSCMELEHTVIHSTKKSTKANLRTEWDTVRVDSRPLKNLQKSYLQGRGTEVKKMGCLRFKAKVNLRWSSTKVVQSCLKQQLIVDWEMMS